MFYRRTSGTPGESFEPYGDFSTADDAKTRCSAHPFPQSALSVLTVVLLGCSGAELESVLWTARFTQKVRLSPTRAASNRH